MTTITTRLNATRFGSLVKARPLGIPLTLLALGAIIFIGAFLRFYHLGADGVGNTYYAAGVKAMLTSWHNFFFVAAEPGGSVTIDKPPLGFWLETISAYFLGVTGFALALPQALAGVLSIPVLYNLIRRPFGTAAGLLAALVLALTPIAIAAERNNTIDGTLVFTLLLAAWAFSRATESGRLHWLWIGAVLVGAAFNIKMMEAFLPLPAFYALYLFGAKAKLKSKLIHLGVASVIVLAVSLSWAVIVDLTPANQRPYVGSSGTNSELNLIVGYNGIERLLGMTQGGTTNNTASTASGGSGSPAAITGQPQLPPGMTVGEMPPGGMNGVGGAPGGFNIGTAGVFRLFTPPLSKEISWLLPLGLLSIVWIGVRERPRWLAGKYHQAVLLWGGWLVTGVVFFSAAGFFHPYYLIILGVPLAALVGIGLQSLWEMRASRPRLALLALAISVSVTVGYTVYNVGQYSIPGTWLPIVIGLAAIGLISTAVITLLPRLITHKALINAVGLAAIVSALVLTPAVWSLGTTFDANASSALPETYSGTSSTFGAMLNGPMGGDTTTNTALIAYLQPRTVGERYMVATQSSMSGAPLVLTTDRGILYMGGFSGSDTVVTTDQLASLVKSGQLSYVLAGGMSVGPNQNTAVNTWLSANCTVVDRSLWTSTSSTSDSAASAAASSGMPAGFNNSQSLYYCAVKTSA